MKIFTFLSKRFSKRFFCIFALLAADYLQAEEYQQVSASYNFIDISSTGVALIEGCDDCARAVEIGFDFTYYGRVYTQLYVGSNGFILPGGSAPEQGERMACCDGRDIPWEDNMAGVIAPWWTDLSLRAQEDSVALEEDGKIYTELQGSSGDYIFIVQYNKVRHFHNLATPEANTFQIKIFQSDNHLEFHYKNIVANNNIHTIGIESPRQDEGIKYFRTSKTTPLPDETKDFAISFLPPGSVKLTSSLRYGAEGNRLTHVFEVNQNIDDISEIEFSEFEPSGSLTEEIDFQNAALVNNNPARFSLDFTLFDSLSGETAGSIFGDLIDFQINSGDFLSLDAQTVFITQSKLLDDDEDKVSAVVINSNGTLLAYKSKDNLKDIADKSALADDVFFVGRDPDTLAGESYQLTRLSGSDECGVPYIDDSEEDKYLFVICTTGGVNKEVELIRYDLNSYLDDELSQTQITVSGSVHQFSGDIPSQALVVSASGFVAYGKDVGGGLQDVIFDGTKVNTTGGSGVLKSLAIDNSGEKLVYVLDNTAYLFSNSLETVISSDGVESAHIAEDGSFIVFNANSEIFTVPAETPLSGFVQKTDSLVANCKLPSLSEKAQRIIVVCDGDLLDLGNDFDNREAVYVIETLNENEVIHLITPKSDASENIVRLTMSSDGASVVFEDGDEENSFALTGLSKLDSKLETNTVKNYPVPFKLSGDGKSGILFYFNALLLLIVFVRKGFLRI